MFEQKCIDLQRQRGGYLILVNDRIDGWKLELSNGWVPGTIARDADGNEFKAVGGNDYDGAEKWEQVPN